MSIHQEGVGNWRGRERWWLLRVKATQHVYRRKTGRVAISWCSRTLRYGQAAGGARDEAGGGARTALPPTPVPRSKATGP